MFILPPNCIVPSATSLTMSPVFPNFLNFIYCAPSAKNSNCGANLARSKRDSKTGQTGQVKDYIPAERLHPASGVFLRARVGLVAVNKLVDEMQP
jgi:hypothetical protein